MIKLKDFAYQKGVTDKAIYKHLNKHKAELEGHYEKRGRNGTWLDEFACNFISNLMVGNPVVIVDSQQQKEIDQLKRKNEELNEKLLKAQEIMLSMKDEINNLQLENCSLRLKIEYHQEKKGFLAKLFKKV